MQKTTLTQNQIISFINDNQCNKELLTLLKYEGTAAIWARKYVTTETDKRVLENGFVIEIDDAIAKMEIIFSNKPRILLIENKNGQREKIYYQLWIEVIDGSSQVTKYYPTESITGIKFIDLFKKIKV